MTDEIAARRLLTGQAWDDFCETIRLTGHEIRLMCLAGACWAMVNGTYMVLVTFAPPLLVARGLSVAEAGFATSLMSWVNLVAVPAG